MFFTTFLISYIGFCLINSVEPRIFCHLNTRTKNFMPSLLALSIIVSLFINYFHFKPTLVWFFFAILAGIFNQSKNFALWRRKSNLKLRSLERLDQIILQVKSGSSLRSAIEQTKKVQDWYTPYMHELIRCADLGGSPQTESKWYNQFAQEVLDIQKSRTKVIEQLCSLRRCLRSEVQVETRVRQVLAGPRLQMRFMGLLFLVLNMITLFQSEGPGHLKLILMAWVLFLSGLLICVWIIRSCRWTV